MDRGWSSRHLQINAILLLHQLNIFSSEAILQDPQGQAKLKQQRTSLKRWLFNVWCSIVQTALTTELWVVFSAD